jgi:hypothetical protein
MLSGKSLLRNETSLVNMKLSKGHLGMSSCLATSLSSICIIFRENASYRKYRVLSELTLGILGVGDIGKQSNL